MNAAQRYRLLAVGLWLGAGLLVWLLAVQQPEVRFEAPLLLLVFGLALFAEANPVQYEREGILLSFGTPFLVGALIGAGPLAAVGTEALVLILASALRSVRGKEKRVWYWALLNLPISMLASVVGSFAYLGVTRVMYQPWSWVPASVAFIGLYLLTNGLLALQVHASLTSRRFTGQLDQFFRSVGVGMVAYTSIALGVGALVIEGQVALLPIFLLPIWVLRTLAIRTKQLDDATYETVLALTIMLQRAHPYTFGHIERVAGIAEEVGLRLGMKRSQARRLREAAVLHDIGKIAIDERILDKPAKLTDAEYEHVKRHSEFGAAILRCSPMFSRLVPWILHHHERPDGKGYPHRLTEAEIPIESRIIAVSDAFDAMVGDGDESNRRSYRQPMTQAEALQELEKCSGAHFDTAVVQAFKEVLLTRRAG